MSSSIEPSLRERRVSAKRLFLGGVAVALIAAIAGAIGEVWRFGPTRASTEARVSLAELGFAM